MYAGAISPLLDAGKVMEKLFYRRPIGDPQAAAPWTADRTAARAGRGALLINSEREPAADACAAHPLRAAAVLVAPATLFGLSIRRITALAAAIADGQDPRKNSWNALSILEERHIWAMYEVAKNNHHLASGYVPGRFDGDLLLFTPTADRTGEDLLPKPGGRTGAAKSGFARFPAVTN